MMSNKTSLAKKEFKPTKKKKNENVIKLQYKTNEDWYELLGDNIKRDSSKIQSVHRIKSSEANKIIKMIAQQDQNNNDSDSNNKRPIVEDISKLFTASGVLPKPRIKDSLLDSGIGQLFLSKTKGNLIL